MSMHVYDVMEYDVMVYDVTTMTDMVTPVINSKPYLPRILVIYYVTSSYTGCIHFVFIYILTYIYILLFFIFVLYIIL